MVIGNYQAIPKVRRSSSPDERTLFGDPGVSLM